MITRLLSRPISYIGSLLILLSFLQTPILAQKIDKSTVGQMRFRHIGPIGNRINSVSGVAGDPLTYIVGAASGGVWKTTDGGLNWRPVFDKQDVHSIGSLSIAPL